jgi:hypothetical protein
MHVEMDVKFPLNSHLRLAFAEVEGSQMAAAAKLTQKAKYLLCGVKI